MITGKWSTRALGEPRPLDNDLVVFLSDGTGWIYQLNRGTWTFDTFKWGWNENGSLFVQGLLHELNDEVVKQSEINFQEIFFDINEMSSEVITITFTVPLGA